MNKVEASDFSTSGSVHKEDANVVTGQLGMLTAIFCGRTIVKVGPDPKRRRGLLLFMSDGSSIGIKCATRPKVTELSLQGNDHEQPRTFHVATG